MPPFLRVLNLYRRVYAGDGGELSFFAVFARGSDFDLGPGFQARDAFDVEGLGAIEAEALGALAFDELEREDAHADEVGAVYPLVALGYDRLYTQKQGTFGGPVAGGAAAVLLTGEHDERGCHLPDTFIAAS